MAPDLAKCVKKAKIVCMHGQPVPPERRQEILDAVQASLSEGKPLTVTLDGLGVPWRTFQNWRDNREEIALAVETARDLGYDKLAYECLAIADDGRNDWMEVRDREGECIGWRVNGEAVQRSKLRVEARLRLLAKWDPRRYGESKRVEVEANVNVTQRHVVEARSLSEDGRAALRRLLAEAQAKGLLPAPDDPADVLDGVYHEVIDDGEAAADDEGD